MSLEEEPVLVSVVAIEETSFVVDVVTPPTVPAVDVTVIDPVASIVVDIPGIEVTSIEVTSFVIDIAVPPALLAIDVTAGDPAATIIVDIPGSGGEDEVIGGKITIGPTPPDSPGVNDVWIDTTSGGTVAPAWPDASTTGHSGSLVAVPGTVSSGTGWHWDFGDGYVIINGAGTTFSGYDVPGVVVVQAADVTISNCRITYNDFYGIEGSGGSSLTVTDCTIIGPGESGTANSGILACDGTYLRNDISLSENGFALDAGTGFVIRNNYIHDLLSAAGDDGHYDGIGIQGGQSDVLVEDNTILARDTSDIIFKNDFGTTDDVTVNHNFLGGNPGFNIVADSTVVGEVTGIVITNNVCVEGFFGYWNIENVSPTFSGNVDSVTGLPVDP